MDNNDLTASFCFTSFLIFFKKLEWNFKNKLEECKIIAELSISGFVYVFEFL